MSESEDSLKTNVRLSYSLLTQFENTSTALTSDSEHLFAACQDKKIRVWLKKDWSLVSELGETNTVPLTVHVDSTQLFATCERRVYVWKKKTWGMIGWFELSNDALASTLQKDRFYVGSKDGRLVSIHKETHETSSWRLHESDIIRIWSDGEIICTGTKKDQPAVWRHKKASAPSEEARLGKERCAEFCGTSEFLLIATISGKLTVWDRRDWSLIKTLDSDSTVPVSAMWANDYYFITGSEEGRISIWDLKSGFHLGSIEPCEGNIVEIIAEKDKLYIADSQSIYILQLSFGETPLNVEQASRLGTGESLLRTSPYDVLESALMAKKKGDEFFQNGAYQDAVKEYERSLQLIIDNTHALTEVPEERKELTNEINDRLSKALLKSRIIEMEELSREMARLSDELDLKGNTSLEENDIEKFWKRAQRCIKESRALAEGQQSNILTFQLTFAADSLESDIKLVKEKIRQYEERVNQALALTHRISREWRWMEKQKTRLEERKEYLERVIAKIDTSLEETESDSEVQVILLNSKEEFTDLLSQITRIIEASDDELEEELMNKAEARSAIEILLEAMPKKRDSMLSIEDKQEQKREYEKLLEILRTALETANNHKLREEARDLRNEITSMKSCFNGGHRQE